MKGATVNVTTLVRKYDKFQSTLPMKGATMMSILFQCRLIFQSTLPMKGATKGLARQVKSRYISIHAPNEGSDVLNDRGLYIGGSISIHAPNEGSDAELKQKKSQFD